MSEKSILHKLTVAPDEGGQRLDRWLSQLEFIPSRSRATELIDKGLVSSQGKKLKPSAKVVVNQVIEILLPEPVSSTLQPLDAPLEILFEDDDLIVVNKPSGLVVHPAAGHAQDTLVNILLHHVKHLSMGFAEQRPGIVHRLDRDTSGILVVAKNDVAHRSLAEQFRHKSAHRMYWAIVHGKPQRLQGTITTHLSRHPQDRKRFASHSGGVGKLAVTHFKVLQTLPSGLAWLSCKLETGRTHQIRVHLSESGWPIVGDVIYSRRLATKGVDAQLGRLALHACELGFEHPRSKEWKSFVLPWPTDLASFAQAMGFKL